MNKDEMIKNDRKEIMDLLDKLEQGELCAPNCYGCFGDGKLSFTYCPDVTDNFEKELANLGYRKIEDDEIVIKKRQYEQLKKYNRDRKRLRLNWQIAEQEKRQILQDVKTIYAKDCGYNFWLADTYFGNEYKRLCKKYGIELE